MKGQARRGDHTAGCVMWTFISNMSYSSLCLWISLSLSYILTHSLVWFLATISSWHHPLHWSAVEFSSLIGRKVLIHLSAPSVVVPAREVYVGFFLICFYSYVFTGGWCDRHSERGLRTSHQLHLYVLYSQPDSCWVEAVCKSGPVCVCTRWSVASQVVCCISPLNRERPGWWGSLRVALALFLQSTKSLWKRDSHYYLLESLPFDRMDQLVSLLNASGRDSLHVSSAGLV